MSHNDPPDHRKGNAPPSTRRALRAGTWLAAGVTIGILVLVAAQVVSHFRTQRTIDDLRRRGGIVETHRLPPAWLMDWTGSDTFGSFTLHGEADLTQVDVTDRDLAELCRGVELEDLMVYGRGLTADGLRRLSRMKALGALTVIDCPALTQAVESELRTALPSLRISRRGAAMLGVAGDNKTTLIPRVPREGEPAHGLSLTGSLQGMRVDHVGPGTAAEHAGVRVGDLLIRFDDSPINGIDAVIAACAQRKPGDIVTLTLIRADSPITVEATLGAWKRN